MRKLCALVAVIAGLAFGAACLEGFDGVRCDAEHPCPAGYGCVEGQCSAGAENDPQDAGEVADGG